MQAVHDHRIILRRYINHFHIQRIFARFQHSWFLYVYLIIYLENRAISHKGVKLNDTDDIKYIHDYTLLLCSMIERDNRGNQSQKIKILLAVFEL